MELPEFKECPNCLGIGEVLISETKVDVCNTCEGEGKVHPQIAEQFISNLDTTEALESEDGSYVDYE